MSPWLIVIFFLKYIGTLPCVDSCILPFCFTKFTNSLFWGFFFVSKNLASFVYFCLFPKHYRLGKTVAGLSQYLLCIIKMWSYVSNSMWIEHETKKIHRTDLIITYFLIYWRENYFFKFRFSLTLYLLLWLTSQQ